MTEINLDDDDDDKPETESRK